MSTHRFDIGNQAGNPEKSSECDGFKFDMGPTWYWMPDVFERYFGDFGKQPSDYYDLIKLSPGYKVFFEDSSHLEIPSNIEEVYQLFEKEETGGKVVYSDPIEEEIETIVTFLSEKNYKSTIDGSDTTKGW